MNRAAASYVIPRDLPWSRLAMPLERAGESLARLDERIHRDAVGRGFVERQHFQEACATLWMAGELVHLDDLVLADADASVRIGTIELTRARRVLQARRMAVARDAAWALSDDALFGAHLDVERSEMVYASDWDEDERLDEWRAVVKTAESLPGLLAAAIAWDAWQEIEPLQQGAWRAGVIAGAVLRKRGLTRHHLLAINVGGRASKYQPAGHHGFADRIAGFLDWAAAAAAAGSKELDRLTLARQVLSAKLEGRRRNSHLPALIDLVLSRPLISATMATKALNVSEPAFTKLRLELGSTLREMTGRSRYRAWGVL